jgi:hypothetical protein
MSKCEKYAVPSWAKPSPHALSLTVLKAGVVVGSVALEQRDHFVFGEALCSSSTHVRRPTAV